MLRVFRNVCRSSFHAYAFLELDQAGFFKKLESASFICRIVRNGNGSAVRNILDILVLVGVNAHAHQDGFSNRNEVCVVLLIEVVQEWFMLVNYKIKISVSKCLIRGNVVREFLYIDLKAVLFSFFGSCFNNLSVRAGCCTNRNFLLFCRSRLGRGCCRLSVGTAAGDDCCCGECAKAGDNQFL